jgi:hypothetical protein
MTLDAGEEQLIPKYQYLLFLTCTTFEIFRCLHDSPTHNDYDACCWIKHSGTRCCNLPKIIRITDASNAAIMFCNMQPENVKDI